MFILNFRTITRKDAVVEPTSFYDIANLFLRQPKRVSQNAPQYSELVRRNFVQSTMKFIHINSVSNNDLINVDDSSAYFDIQSSSTVSGRGSKDCISAKGLYLQHAMRRLHHGSIR